MNIILGVVLILFMILEMLFPLRVNREKKVNRLIHNFSFALVALPITRLLTLPLVYGVVLWASKQNMGLLNILDLDPRTEFAIGFLFLDYTLYWWHLANHKIAFLWRFHQVHHADKDMDAATALRFHFGELTLSAGFRCMLAAIFGFGLPALMAFDLAVTSFAIFHHSNFKLPQKLDRFLSYLIVTPLYHQTHHSFYQNETDSNYSAILSVWDRIHQSFKGFFSPSEITIGLPVYEKENYSFFNLLKMPLFKLKKWPSEFKSRL